MSDPCSGQRAHTDAVVMLVQQKHSSYDAKHSTEASSVVDNLRAYYSAVAAADVLLWHEGNYSLPASQVDGSDSVNVRSCNLQCTAGWGPPRGMSVPPVLRMWGVPFSLGYRNMIRWYSVTIWTTLFELGYRHVMRIDDDSVFLSRVPYNLFDRLRTRGAVYGYRQTSSECGSAAFKPFVTQAMNLSIPYCRVEEEIQGFYNNFFISDISWWLTPAVQRFVRAFDASGLIYTQRDNDLVFQSAVVRLLSTRSATLKFADWGYAHITVNSGRWLYGGASVGSNEPAEVEAVDRRFQAWARNRYNISVRTHQQRCGSETLLVSSKHRGFWHVAPSCPYFDRNESGTECNTRLQRC